ncbi:MAG TPA: hypothetical protein VFL76_10525 [Edaphocola sp.]|nr:hypothetical protein [Edaphocola sp.]
MLQTVIARIYEASLLSVAVFAVFRYRQADKSTRYILFWIWLGLLTEVLGDISIALFKTNMPVYALSCLLEFMILCGYFNQSVRVLKAKNLGLFIGGLGTLLGILNICFLQPLTVLNANFLFFECLVIVCLSLYALYRMLVEPGLKLWQETHFCFACLLIFYECVSLWNWGFYDYIIRSYPEKSAILNICLLTGNILTYAACGLIIYLYPKMRQTHV